jgi:hypothetical protein
MIAAIEDAGGIPLYTEYQARGHDAWTAAYNEPLLYTWMFSRSLGGMSETFLWDLPGGALQEVPEASTLALLATGVPGLLFIAWRRRRSPE